eukprot:scaffold172355_cov78-Attheya_sp.AAC.1
MNNVKITFSLKSAFLIDDPLLRRLETYGETQSTGQVKRVHFQFKNHVKWPWGSKTTLIIVKNCTMNNVKITFSAKFAFLIDDPLPRGLGSYGVTQSTGQVQRGHFQSKNHVKL